MYQLFKNRSQKRPQNEMNRISPPPRGEDPIISQIIRDCVCERKRE